MSILASIKNNKSDAALIIGAALIALAILASACLSKPGFTPNPAGGVWLEKDGAIYLCRMNVDKPATCISARDGKTLSYNEIAKN